MLLELCASSAPEQKSSCFIFFLLIHPVLMTEKLQQHLMPSLVSDHIHVNVMDPYLSLCLPSVCCSHSDDTKICWKSLQETRLNPNTGIKDHNLVCSDWSTIPIHTNMCSIHIASVNSACCVWHCVFRTMKSDGGQV